MKINADRFWSKVSIPDDGPVGCWLWQGIIWKGYGKFKDGDLQARAHRVAYLLTRGPIPDGLIVRHYACRNRACVNPMHLELGTPADNAEDRERDGTTAKGARFKRSCLTDADVQVIRARVAAGERQSDVALEYGIKSSSMHSLVHRQSWKHVA